MKFYIIIIVCINLTTIGCSNGKNDKSALLFLMGGQRYIVLNTLELDQYGNAVTCKNGTTVETSAPASMSAMSLNKYASGLPNDDVIYLTGRKGTIDVMLELRYSGIDYDVRTVLFRDTPINRSGPEEIRNKPYSAYPSAFVIAGQKYLLFSDSYMFRLYEYEFEDDQIVQYKRSYMWDFSNIENYIVSVSYAYRGLNQMGHAWTIAPDYNVTTQRLYFTLCGRVPIPSPSWNPTEQSSAMEIREFEATLSGTSFNAPTMCRGAIDPYDGSHYVDGNPRTWADFEAVIPDEYYAIGHGWIGKLYTDSTGTKGYFTSMRPQFIDTYGIIKSGDPIIATSPNAENYMYHGITDREDSRITYTDIYSVDIAPDGTFSNMLKLPAPVNRGGINYVSDISDDGSRIYVSHMDMGANFYDYVPAWAWDVVTLELMMRDAYRVGPWNGYVEIFEKQGDGSWLSVSILKSEF